ncbi:glycoside hydrolase family 43 protein [Miniimonas sp. S16]|uniref:glycoside hydrolase family 43 protein n=1 Tax=Miniimonas sp. S16 TaxID=2171623 RepID=UPI000D527621|nr:glycoside hydrolase family 43 protein [Miniimonas sp. S16]
MTDRFGYLLVHFVEDAQGHAEKVYLSLSEGDDPLRWRRLNGGEAVLESRLSTTGVRDPFLVRRRDGAGFHVLATDLRVWGRGEPDWDAFTRHGSRSLVLWDSTDLVTWSAPRLVEVAPPSFGMAWAPTVSWDAQAGHYRVFFSGKRFADDDPDHTGDAAAAVWCATTSDFETFSDPELYLALPTGVIDLVAVPDGDLVHVVAKQDDAATDSAAVFHQVRHGFDDAAGRTVATRIGADLGPHVEGPLLFRENDGGRWFLWVDQYDSQPQGFRALTSHDPASGSWTPVPEGEFVMPLNTKHGGLIPLTRQEWERVAAHDAARVFVPERDELTTTERTM